MNIKNTKPVAKAIKGYWSNGRFVKPEEIALEEVGPPSKTQLKAEADEKQALGEALLTLRTDLMARLDLPEKLLMTPIRAAIDEQANGSADLTLALHLAEQWRDKLIAADDALSQWLDDYPATDSQQLRALIRQARKDIAKPETPGEAPRHNKAYREIFQLVKQAMAQEPEA